jgi:excinuclease ABC subunit B
MQKAIDITETRREIQIAYNKEHGITPKGIIKDIHDVLEAGYGDKQSRKTVAVQKVAEERATYQAMSPKELNRLLENLEKQMYEHSRNLEFEEAAKKRDELEHIRQLANF